jgi:hypothetical protein
VTTPPHDLNSSPDSCHVYWGSHGCHRPKLHEGDCWCDCCECGDDHPRADDDYLCVAGPPYYGPRTVFYGADAQARGLNTVRDPVIGRCAVCGEVRRDDEPDPCLGMLPGVWAACCGHGDPERAYVAISDGQTLYGPAAVAFFARTVQGK